MATWRENLFNTEVVQNIEALKLKPIQAGTMWITDEDEQVFFDINSTSRICFSSMILLNTDVERLELILNGTLVKNKIYFIKDTKKMWIYNDTWLDLTDTFRGPKGLDGLDGTDGLPGPAGTSSYLHVRYGATASPGSLSTTPMDYIGIAVTTSSVAPSTSVSYTWFKIKGETGATGGITYDWLDGSGAPASGTGKQGDMYLNNDNCDVYKKTSPTAWTFRCNIKGAPGTNATIPKNNLTATEKPTENDYNGYAPGSLWFQNVTAGDGELLTYVFMCREINGNKAVWVRFITGFGY